MGFMQNFKMLEHLPIIDWKALGCGFSRNMNRSWLCGFQPLAKCVQPRRKHWQDLVIRSVTVQASISILIVYLSSDVHTEAVQAALAKHKERKMAVPMPSKRRSLVVQTSMDAYTPPGTDRTKHTPVDWVLICMSLFNYYVQIMVHDMITIVFYN